MQFSARKAAARIAVATAVIGVSMVFTPIAAMADDSFEPVQPPTSVTVSNVSVTMPGDGTVGITYGATLGEEHPQQDGIVQFLIEEVSPDCSGSSSTSSAQTFTESEPNMNFVVVLSPNTRWVIVHLNASDGAGGFAAVGTYTTYIPISIGDAGPSSTVAPDASGTGGAFNVHTDALMPSYVLGTWINDVFQGEFTLDACSDVSVPFSGLAPGDYIELRSPDLLGFVIDSYTAPGGTAKGPQLDTQATDATTELAQTGEVTWPLLVLAIALLGTGSYLAFRRTRQVGPPTS